MGSTVTFGSRISLRLDFVAPSKQGWTAGAIVLTRDDDAAIILGCGTSNNGSGGPSSFSGSADMSATDRIYLFAKGHVLNATGLIASTDVAIGSCYFGGLNELPSNSIDFAKASLRAEKTLNWRVE